MNPLLRTIRILVITALIFNNFPCTAQQSTQDSTKAKEFGMRHLIAPAVLTAGGTLLTYEPNLNRFNVAIRDRVQSDNHSPFHIDDVFQYVPAGSAYLLKLCGMESKSTYKELTKRTALSYLATAATVLTLKHTTHILRPDGTRYNSFPSGHTATAFVGAEILRREYGEQYPYIAVAGYTVATGVGLMRIYNNRHWAGDVLAGAGLGILCAGLSYLISPYLTF